MKATYIGTGDRGDDVTCKVFGKEFQLNEPLDVTDLDEEHQTLLRGNPTFVIDDPKQKPATKADEPKPPEPVVSGEPVAPTNAPQPGKLDPKP